MRLPGATGDLLLMVYLWDQGLAGLLMSKGFMNKLAGVKIYLRNVGLAKSCKFLAKFPSTPDAALQPILLQCICNWVCCPQFTTPLSSPGFFIQIPNFSISWESSSLQGWTWSRQHAAFLPPLPPRSSYFFLHLPAMSQSDVNPLGPGKGER